MAVGGVGGKGPIVQLPNIVPKSVTETVEKLEKKAEGWIAKGTQEAKKLGGQAVDKYKDLTGSKPKTGPHIENGFKYVLSGGDPVATGSAMNQAKQSARTAQLGAYAGTSIGTGGRAPPDFVTNSTLKALSAIPPIAGQPTAKAVYTSHASCSPEKAYEQFTKHPNDLFGAAGLKLRPAVTELKDGARAFIEDAGPPPVWAPVEFKLDPKNSKVTITTLDGHPLRGTNEFEFKGDGKGGTNMVQTSLFQGSSPLVEVGKATGAIDRQHASGIL